MAQPVRNHPGAGFSTRGMLVKLMLLPALLVGLFVALAILAGWARFTPGDPEDALAALQRGGGGPWRAAALVRTLAEPRNRAMRQDPRLLDRLIALLWHETARADTTSDAVELRSYLCLAIGQFELAGGVPVLADTARGRGDPAEVPLRVAALEALALLANRLGPQVLHLPPADTPSGPTSSADSAAPRANVHSAAPSPDGEHGAPVTALAVVVDCADDRDARVRGAAAYTLGVAGGAEAEQRLRTLLLDTVAGVRYNAATGLARLGDPTGAAVLAEMLEVSMQHAGPTESPAFDDDQLARNALRAAEKLGEAVLAAEGSVTAYVDDRTGVAETAVPIEARQGLDALHRAVGRAARRHPSPQWRTRAAAVERRLQQAGFSAP